MSNKFLIVVIVLISLINLLQSKDEPYYRVYINENDLTYIDGVTGDTIFTETVDWVNPSPLHQAIINDNE